MYSQEVQKDTPKLFYSSYPLGNWRGMVREGTFLFTFELLKFLKQLCVIFFWFKTFAFKQRMWYTSIENLTTNYKIKKLVI